MVQSSVLDAMLLLMATITKRGSYQWRAMIRKKGYPTISKTFTFRRDAEIWARQTEAEMERGAWVDRTESEQTTLKEALERYAREITPKKKGAPQELNRINKLKSLPLAQKTLASLRSTDFAQYRDERLSSVSASSVRLELAIFSNLFTVAQRDWGIEGIANPVKVIKKPSAKGSERDRRLYYGEEDRLIVACRQYGNIWLVPIVQFAIETAMRRSEILSLVWDNIDIKKQTAYLPDTKNSEPRTVPLSMRAIEILTSLPRSISGRVFPTTDAAIKHGFYRACKRAKSADGKKDEPIVNLRFHDLRHEAASRLFEKGLNPMQVAAITGHKTLQMLKRYTHLKAEDLAKMLG